jgi:hypothetical protein
MRKGRSSRCGRAESGLADALARKLANAQWRRLATPVGTAVGGIVANCKLGPRADAMSHSVSVDLGEFAQALMQCTPRGRGDVPAPCWSASWCDNARARRRVPRGHERAARFGGLPSIMVAGRLAKVRRRSDRSGIDSRCCRRWLALQHAKRSHRLATARSARSGAPEVWC